VTIPARDLADLQKVFPGLRPAEPLARHTTWGIGGPADFYVEISSRADLTVLRQWARDRGVPLMPIGQGSNLLIRGRGRPRAASFVCGARFEEIRFEGTRGHGRRGRPVPAASRVKPPSAA
jgi:UDP-N-acetylmuramate dehydrogenase